MPIADKGGRADDRQEKKQKEGNDMGCLWCISIVGIPVGGQCFTVIGIPFGLQQFKLARLALMPFGAQVTG